MKLKSQNLKIKSLNYDFLTFYAMIMTYHVCLFFFKVIIIRSKVQMTLPLPGEPVLNVDPYLSPTHFHLVQFVSQY